MWDEEVLRKRGLRNSLLLSVHMKSIQTTVVGCLNLRISRPPQPQNLGTFHLALSKGIYHKALNLYKLPFILLSFEFHYCNSFTWKLKSLLLILHNPFWLQSSWLKNYSNWELFPLHITNCLHCHRLYQKYPYLTGGRDKLALKDWVCLCCISPVSLKQDKTHRKCHVLSKPEHLSLCQSKTWKQLSNFMSCAMTLTEWNTETWNSSQGL